MNHIILTFKLPHKKFLLRISLFLLLSIVFCFPNCKKSDCYRCKKIETNQWGTTINDFEICDKTSNDHLNLMDLIATENKLLPKSFEI